MKASLIKRFSAFLIDTFILSIIFSIITLGFVINTGDIENELNDALEQYENMEITAGDYTDKVIDLNYRLQKSNFTINILNVVLYVGYFVIFAYLNNGQTIGKKIVKIKVVNDKGKSPSICNMIVRSLFIYGIATLLYSVVFVYVLNNTMFTYGYIAITYVEAFFMMISFVMILYKKDGRGLHDIFGRTNVIEEVK